VLVYDQPQAFSGRTELPVSLQEVQLRSETAQRSLSSLIPLVSCINDNNDSQRRYRMWQWRSSAVNEVGRQVTLRRLQWVDNKCPNWFGKRSHRRSVSPVKANGFVRSWTSI